MKQWKSFFRDSLSRDAIKGQFKPGSHLVRIFMFAAVASITLGVIYNFVGQYLGQTRASTENITLTTGPSKDVVALNEDFTVNVVMAAPAGKKVSQVDLRMTVTGQDGGDVTYTAGGYEVLATGVSGAYFNSADSPLVEKLDGTAPGKKYRLTLSSDRPSAELLNQVTLKIKFKGTANGKVLFTVDNTASEIVGPGGAGAEPISYSISGSSSRQATVTIGQGPTATQGPTNTQGPTSTTAPSSAPSPTKTTDTKPTPTITLAPAPTCTNPESCLPSDEGKTVSMINREFTDVI